MKSTHKTTKTNTALCGLLSGLLLLAAGTAQTHAGLLVPAAPGAQLYVANISSNTIVKFTPGGVGSVFATTILPDSYGLAFDSAGNLYVSSPVYNSGNGGIEKFTTAGVGSSFASLQFPGSLAFDSAGNLYVANYGNNTIQQFSSTGTDLGVFADSSDGLNGPLGLAFGPVPEPTSAALLLGSGAMLLLRRRRTAV